MFNKNEKAFRRFVARNDVRNWQPSPHQYEWGELFIIRDASRRWGVVAIIDGHTASVVVRNSKLCNSQFLIADVLADKDKVSGEIKFDILVQYGGVNQMWLTATTII